MMRRVRTTVTLDPDTEQLVQRRMRERGETFKQALNGLLRDAVRATSPVPAFRTETAAMGTSRVSLDRALQLASDLEDDERIRSMRTSS